ncbi:MAG: hypothetical protein ACN0LA_05165 [Candidatus Longimicrobiales bacterium M2_2A_002]
MERESSAGAVRSPEDAGGALGGGHGSGDQAVGQSELLARWSDREEVRAIPDVLRPAELLVAVGSGTVVRSGRLAQSRWLVLVTDRRLLCIKGRDPVTRKVIDMPISQIRGVEVRGLVRKTLSLDTGFGTLRIGGLDRSTAVELDREVTRLMGAYDEEPS